MDKYEVLDEKHFISLDKLISNGVVCEELAEFEESIFSDVYRKGIDLIKTIIEDNETWQKRKRGNGSSAFEISNVISFVGRRGTGKTSSMLSLAEALKNYGSDQRYARLDKIMKFSGPTNSRNVAFYALDCIDASEMEESEDIFILILANMFEKILNVKDKTNSSINASLSEYKNRTIFQKFEKIYEDFVTLNKNDELSEGYSTFEKLRTLASSQRIRSNFESLVEIYLDIMEEYDQRIDGNRREGYLVIILDDLDMTVERKMDGFRNWGSYRSMRSIQKYLTVPRVIVLAAYNNVNLYKRCSQFFQRQYAGKDEMEIKSCDNKASQFMEKVFPIYTRIYMPSWRKRDLDSETKNKIKFNNNTTNILRRFQKESRNETELTIKEFCLALLSEKTGIYFDSEGRKHHFFEPDTLRSLFNMTRLLVEMQSLPLQIQTLDEFHLFLYNIERIKEDCLFRFVEDKLIMNEHELFEEWQKRPIERRAQEIVRLLSKTTIPLGLKVKEEHREEIYKIEHHQNIPYSRALDNSLVSYSYAELIHSIYHMTRDWKKYSKELVYCILYSFTLQLTEVYEKYRWSKKQIGKEEFFQLYRRTCVGDDDDEKQTEDVENIFFKKAQNYYQILKAVIGETICGKWAEYYFPRVGYDEVIEKNFILGFVEKGGKKFAIDLENDKEKMEKSIQEILIISMLHLDVLNWPSSNFICEKKVENRDKSENEETKEYFTITVYCDLSDFELTGFFKYAFSYAEFLSKIENLLMNSIKKSEEKEVKTEEAELYQSYKTLIGEIFRELWEKFYEWDQNYGNMMIPIYNLDISYNLVKRVFGECKEVNLSSVTLLKNVENKEEDIRQKNILFFKEYKKMLDRFSKHLEKIDRYYKLGEMNSFAAAYKKCPFYDMVKNLNDEESIGIICNYISEIIIKISNDQEDKSSPD